jgi:hypothetical protein
MFQPTMRDSILAYLNRGLGQAKQQYQPKGVQAGGSRYSIVPGGNCNYNPVGATQNQIARGRYGSDTNLTFDQIDSLFRGTQVPVTEVGGSSSVGWYIGGGTKTPALFDPPGCTPNSGFVAGRTCNCQNQDLRSAGLLVATPDGGLVLVSPGVYSPGMVWTDLVEKTPAPAVTLTPTVVTLPAPTSPPPAPIPCSPGYQQPPTGSHITCIPGYGWSADPSGSGCEICNPLCAPGWSTPDQGPSTCPAGEYLAVDPRTRCVKCVRGANCFLPGENPIPCGPPYTLEARGQYTCCVVPSVPTTLAPTPTATTPAPAPGTPVDTSQANVGFSTGVKIAIGAAVLLLALGIMKKSAG